MDLYRVLGVPRDAPVGEIKAAYRRLALAWHPDRHAGAPEARRTAAAARFRELAEAYEILSKPHKRAIYNREGRAGLNRGPDSRPSYRPGRSSYSAGAGTSSTAGGGNSGGHGGRFAWWAAPLRGMTRGDAYFHLVIAGVAMAALVFSEPLADVLWNTRNSGKSFEEAMEALEQRRREQKAASPPLPSPTRPQAPPVTSDNKVGPHSFSSGYSEASTGSMEKAQMLQSAIRPVAPSSESSRRVSHVIMEGLKDVIVGKRVGEVDHHSSRDLGHTTRTHLEGT